MTDVNKMSAEEIEIWTAPVLEAQKEEQSATILPSRPPEPPTIFEDQTEPPAPAA